MFIKLNIIVQKGDLANDFRKGLQGQKIYYQHPLWIK